jgi:hypothetical protein
MPHDEDLNKELRRTLLYFWLAGTLKYIDTAEAALERTQNEASTDFDALPNDDPAFDYQNYTAFLEEERANHLFGTVPFMLWSSAFIGICALFELELTRVAQWRHASRNGREPKNPALVKRFSRFNDLVGELTLEFPEIRTGSDWEEVDVYREIRHVMVHHGSHILILSYEEKAELTGFPGKTLGNR